MAGLIPRQSTGTDTGTGSIAKLGRSKSQPARDEFYKCVSTALLPGTTTALGSKFSRSSTSTKFSTGICVKKLKKKKNYLKYKKVLLSSTAAVLESTSLSPCRAGFVLNSIFFKPGDLLPWQQIPARRLSFLIKVHVMQLPQRMQAAGLLVRRPPSAEHGFYCS